MVVEHPRLYNGEDGGRIWETSNHMQSGVLGYRRMALPVRHTAEKAMSLDPEKYCRDCGYVLNGLSENRCPECGRPFDPEDAKSYLRHRRRIGRTAVCAALLVAALIALGASCYYGLQTFERREIIEFCRGCGAERRHKAYFTAGMNIRSTEPRTCRTYLSTLLAAVPEQCAHSWELVLEIRYDWGGRDLFPRRTGATEIRVLLISAPADEGLQQLIRRIPGLPRMIREGIFNAESTEAAQLRGSFLIAACSDPLNVDKFLRFWNWVGECEDARPGALVLDLSRLFRQVASRPALRQEQADGKKRLP